MNPVIRSFCFFALIFLVGPGCGGKKEDQSKKVTAKPAKKASVKKQVAPTGPPKKKRKQQAEIVKKTAPSKKQTKKEAVTKTEQPPAKKVKQARANDNETAIEKLERELASFKVPPDWFKDVRPTWRTSQPWKKARQEIRRLLGTNNERMRRQAIKLTWQYLQKNDIGNGHEYGMYMFLGNEPLWAIIAYREYVFRKKQDYPPYFGLKALASLYADYGVYEEGEKLLKLGLTMNPPKAAWREIRRAEMHDALGDHFTAWGKIDQAKENYQEAIRLYPMGRPPYGRHLLPRRVKKVQSKVDLLSMTPFQQANLRDGVFREKALGYSGDIGIKITVADGAVTKIDIQHKEKIDQNACKVIPKRIIAKQHLKVDGISGATVTKNAIVGGTLRALRRAGLK